MCPLRRTNRAPEIRAAQRLLLSELPAMTHDESITLAKALSPYQ
jgi:hypothetical protein